MSKAIVYKLAVAGCAFVALALAPRRADAAQWCRWQITDGMETWDVNGRESSYWGLGPKFTSDEVCTEFESKFGKKLGSFRQATWVCTEVKEQARAQLDVVVQGAPQPGNDGKDPKRLFDKNAEPKLGALGGGLFQWLNKVADNVPGAGATPGKALYQVTFHLPNGASQTAAILVDNAKQLGGADGATPAFGVVAIARTGQGSILCASGLPVDELAIQGVPVGRLNAKTTSVGTLISLPKVDHGSLRINGRSIVVQKVGEPQKKPGAQ